MSADPAEGQDHGFSDEPLADLTDDVLGRDRFAMSAVDLIERVGASPESTVLAVVGQWGLGKTTLLNAIRTELKGRVRRGKFWITAEFNPWYYQDLASLQVGFFRELSAALPSGPSWQKARTRIADFADAVAPLGAFAAPLGADISPMIERAAAMTRGGTGVLDAKAAVEKSLRKVDRPVLMVIDDIDRLDPAELLLLFKLIRLAGRLPNVYYLLAYDEETLLDALSRTGLIGADSPRRALDYMEKIIQVRLDLPPVRERQLSSWVDRELTLSAGRLGVALDKAQRERFDKAYFGHIRLRLRTPRAVQRLFTQVESLASNLAHEVDFVDFFILSWMRSAEPLLYRAISQHRTRLLGEMLDPSGEGWPFDRDKQADHAHWAAVMSRARVDQPHVEGVARIMGQLFPKFAEQWAGESASSVPTQGRVAHSNYFDRFFAFAVPADDVSDQMVRKALSQVAEERDGPEREQLGQLWSTQADLVIEKVGRYWVPGRVDGVLALRWLARWYLFLPNDDYSMAPPRRRLVNIAYTHFITLEQAEPAAAVRVMMEEDPSLEFVEGVVSYIAGEAVRTSARSPEFVAAEAAFAKRVAHVFREQGSTNPLDYPDRVWNLFRSWVYADAPAVRAWVRHHRDAGSWPLLDLLARMVSRAVPMGVPDPVAIVGELDLLLVDEVVGLNEVRDGLREELARSQPGLSHRAPATPDNLRVAALMQLRASDGTRSET